MSGGDVTNLLYGGQFGGYQSDFNTDAGVIYCRNRWYIPRLGRWLSRDPIGYDGGPNLYEYCSGDPINSIDPSGLSEKEAVYWIRQMRNDIIHVAAAYDIQPELLAGVVWNEQYAGKLHLLPGYANAHRGAGEDRFVYLNQAASLGIVEMKHDPTKINGCGTRAGRDKFVTAYQKDYKRQLADAASKLAGIARLPNRYPGRTGQLTKLEMAIVITSYNQPVKPGPAASTRPSKRYGMVFYNNFNHIQNALCGK
jgi:RHS repeat-associated protein